MRRHDVHQSRPQAVFEPSFQRVHVERSVVGGCFARCAGDADDAESVIGEDVGGEEIRRRLHDDDVAGFRQRRARDVQPVARAGDQKQLRSEHNRRVFVYVFIGSVDIDSAIDRTTRPARDFRVRVREKPRERADGRGVASPSDVAHRHACAAHVHRPVARRDETGGRALERAREDRVRQRRGVRVPHREVHHAIGLPLKRLPVVGNVVALRG